MSSNRGPDSPDETLPETLLEVDETIESQDELFRPEELANCGPDCARTQSVEELGLRQEGRYNFIKLHGQGGQAKVYMAFDQQIGRLVAIKEMRPLAPAGAEPAVTGSSQSHTSFVGRFLREARITGQLEHQNITPVHELGRTEDDRLYYSMRFIHGETLAKRLASCQGLKERLKLLGAYWDLCNAIAYAHSRGVIHRDIKPSNVIMGSHGQTLVVDWGIAKTKGMAALDTEAELGGPDTTPVISGTDGGATMAGALIGTPAYMSPEQARGETGTTDERADVWGLGVVLYQMLTGKKPFSGGSWSEIVFNLVEQEHDSVLQVCPEAPVELATVVDKALQKDPAKRYRNAGELAEEMSAYMTGGRVRAHAYSSWDLFRRFALRNKVALAAAASIFVVILVSLVFVLFSLDAEREARHLADKAFSAERDAQLSATFHLAQALNEKAFQLAEKKHHGLSAVFAAAALVNNPAHEKSLFHEAGFSKIHPESLQLRTRSASLLYRLGFEPGLVLEQVFSSAGLVESVDISPDGKLVAASRYGGIIDLWDRSDKGKSRTLIGHKGRVFVLDFSKSGRLLASCGGDRTFRLWDVAAGRELRKFPVQEVGVLDVQISSDEKTLAVAREDGQISLWDIESGTRQGAPPAHRTRALSVAFSPDGKWVASGGGEGVVHVSKRDGRDAWSIHGSKGTVMSLQFSPNGKLLASAEFSGKITLTDIRSTKKVLSIQAQEVGVYKIVFSPDGRMLAVSGFGKTIMLIDVASGQVITEQDAHDDMVAGLNFSSDGRLLVSSSHDGMVKLWRMREAKEMAWFSGHREDFQTIGCDRDGHFLAVGYGSGRIQLWTLPEGKPLSVFARHEGRVYKTLFSPDSSKVLSMGRDGTARLWDVASKKEIARVGPNTDFSKDAAFSPDGKTIALAGLRGDVYIVDGELGGVMRRFHIHEGGIVELEFSPDGKTLATCSLDGTVKLLDWSTGRILGEMRGHGDWLSSVSFSPDGSILAGGGKDKDVFLWDVSTGRRLRVLTGHGGWVNILRWSPDGKLLLSVSDDKSIRLWDWRSGEALLILDDMQDMVGVCFREEGQDLLVADGERVRIFPLDFSIRSADPQRLLRAAEEAAGVKIDGFGYRQQK